MKPAAPAFIHSALDDAGLTPNQFRLYCHAVRRAGGTSGTFWESIQNSAALCKIHVKTARKAVAVLLDLNLIQLAEHRNGRPKVYRITNLDEWKPLPIGYPGIKLGRVSKWKGTPTNRIPPTLPNPIPPKVIPEGNPLKVMIIKSKVPIESGI